MRKGVMGRIMHNLCKRPWCKTIGKLLNYALKSFLYELLEIFLSNSPKVFGKHFMDFSENKSLNTG